VVGIASPFHVSIIMELWKVNWPQGRTFRSPPQQAMQP
jgi:hypothetical protein